MLFVYDNDVFLCAPFMNAHAIANILEGADSATVDVSAFDTF